MTETWRPVVGYEKTHSVSSHGRVRSRSRVLKQRCNVGGGGYMLVDLCARNTVTTRSVHSLVLEAFGGPRPTPRHQGRHHPDPTPSNNHATNLRWGTPKQNCADIPPHRRGRWATPLSPPRPQPPRPGNHPKLTVATATAIRASSLSNRALARLHGVSATTVQRIRAGTRYRLP